MVISGRGGLKSLKKLIIYLTNVFLFLILGGEIFIHQNKKLMKLSMSKALFIASAGICCLGAGVLLAQYVDLALNLGFESKGIQHITDYVMFAVPKSDGGWNDQGQVKVSADKAKLKIEGSLVSNTSAGNVGGNIATSSLLGGSENVLVGAVSESSILGGNSNSNASHRAFIAGGRSNTINSESESAVIL